MQQVPIEPIQQATAVIDEFNRLDLSKVVLTEGGKPLPVTAKMLEEFRFVGFTNKNFVELRWWEGEE